MQIKFYTKDNCSLCEEAYALLKMLEHYYTISIEEIDIYSDDRLLERYQLLIPAVKMNDTFLSCEEMTFEKLEQSIQNELKAN